MSLTSRQFLAIYTVKVRKRHSEEVPFEFLIESNEHQDFYLTLETFFAELKKTNQIDKDDDSVLGIDNLVSEPRKRRISGFLNSGYSGVNGKLHDTEKNNSAGNIERKHAPLYNYYFSFYIPQQGESGILALHSRGNHGSKTALLKSLKNYLVEKDLGISVSFEPTALDFKRDYKKFHKHFHIKKLQVIDYIPKRNEDRVMGGGNNKELVKVTHSVGLGRNVESLFGFNEFANATNYAMVAKKKFQNYTNIKNLTNKARFAITVEMDGQEKSMNIENDMSFQMSFDLTEDFDTYNRKDPTFTKLHEVCETYIKHAVKHIC